MGHFGRKSLLRQAFASMGEHDRCSNLGESRCLSSVSLYSMVELDKHWAVGYNDCELLAVREMTVA